MGRYFQSLFRLDGNCWRSSQPIAIAVCPFIIHTNSLVITPLTWLSSGFFRKSIESERRPRWRWTATAIMAQWWARQKSVQFLCNTCVYILRNCHNIWHYPHICLPLSISPNDWLVKTWNIFLFRRCLCK